MAWNEEKSKERVAKNDFSDLAINVQDLARTMDFKSLVKTDVRRAKGVHFYVDVPNFHKAVGTGSQKGSQRGSQKGDQSMGGRRGVAEKLW